MGWSAALANGAAMAIRRKFSASHFWEDTRKFNATAFNYIGETTRYLMNQPAKPDDRNNPVEKIVGNGLRPDIWKPFKKRFGISKVYEFYGATEMLLAFYNLLNLDNTMGFNLDPYAIVRYDLDTDEPVRSKNGFFEKVDRGEAGLLLGEILDRTPFAGYTDEASSRKKIFRDVFAPGDMWLNTGDMVRDLGFRHAQFVDRLGDTFRWKGENVSTAEVEEIVNSFPDISHSAVYGVVIQGTDGRAGMASLVPSVPVPQFDFQGFCDHLHRALPSYAVPIFIRIKTEFDTTDTHKIKKTDLKKEGFDLDQLSDPVYVLLPGSNEYTPLTREIHEGIIQGQYRF